MTDEVGLWYISISSLFVMRVQRVSKPTRQRSYGFRLGGLHGACRACRVEQGFVGFVGCRFIGFTGCIGP